MTKYSLPMSIESFFTHCSDDCLTFITNSSLDFGCFFISELFKVTPVNNCIPYYWHILFDMHISRILPIVNIILKDT